MNIEVLIPSQTSSNNGHVHYRRIGEQHPLCRLRRNDWQVITFTERVVNYAMSPICMKCIAGKRKLENQKMGLE